jgi:hypothetical protein
MKNQLTIREVKEKYEAGLLKIKGVVSVGIGLNKYGTPVIIVGINQQNKRSIRRIPTVLEGYMVEVQLIETIKAQELV